MKKLLILVLFVCPIKPLGALLELPKKLELIQEIVIPLEPFKTPNPKLRYDQVSFLGSHNAFANNEEGFIYAQQKWSTKKQLDRGVRVLLPDFHIDADRVARLCHNKCHISMTLRSPKALLKKHRSVLDFFKEIKRWLDAHPQEIVTIEIENYIGNDKTFNLIKQAGLLPYALTPKDWDPVEFDHKWPTLEWMIKHKKRLVIFDTGNPKAYGFSTNRYMQRNQYGTYDRDKAAAPRDNRIIKPKPRIFQLNYFGTPTSPLALHNTSPWLSGLIEKIRKKGYIRPGQQMNQIVLDNVHLGNSMALVNALNKNLKPERLPARKVKVKPKKFDIGKHRFAVPVSN